MCCDSHMYMGCNWKNHGCNRYHSMCNLKVMHLILMIQVGYRRIGKDSLSPLGSTFQPTQFPLPRLIFFFQPKAELEAHPKLSSYLQVQPRSSAQCPHPLQHRHLARRNQMHPPSACSRSLT
jgi:hypothetical protein